jgi:hypothetical protein
MSAMPSFVGQMEVNVFIIDTFVPHIRRRMDFCAHKMFDRRI